MYLASFGKPTVFNMHISYVESISTNGIGGVFGTLTLSILHSDIEKIQKTGNCFSVVVFDKIKYTFTGAYLRKIMHSEYSTENIDVEFDFGNYEKLDI